jgi:hypothetical protein
MNTRLMTLAASLLAGVLGSHVPAARAQTGSPPGATATRPPTTADHTSVPNAAPPASTTQTTGSTAQDATVKKMNEDEKQKVDTKGK